MTTTSSIAVEKKVVRAKAKKKAPPELRVPSGIAASARVKLVKPKVAAKSKFTAKKSASVKGLSKSDMVFVHSARKGERRLTLVVLKLASKAPKSGAKTIGVGNTASASGGILFRFAKAAPKSGPRPAAKKKA